MDEGLHTPHHRFLNSSEEWHGFPTLMDLRSIPENDLLGNASGSFGINEEEACQDVSSFAGSSGSQWGYTTAAPAAPQHAQHQDPPQSQLIFDQANAAFRQAKSPAAADGAGSDISNKRAKNREASRRSRAKKKQREEELVRANEELQRENMGLKSEIAAKNASLEQLRKDLACERTAPQYFQELLNVALKEDQPPMVQN